ncbi:MAG: lysozyme inhibitor LprI family protein [Geminicoccaceae bacterium]
MTLRLWFAIAALGLLAACAKPPVELTEDEAVAACSSAASGQASGAVFDPPGAAQVNRSPQDVGRQPLAAVVAANGRSTGAKAGRQLRYTCLIGPAGDVLFIDVVDDGAGLLAAQCPAGPGRVSCLSDLLTRTERDLAAAEAAAISAGRSRAGGKARAEIDEPAAASIGAWRVYRDAECRRRQEVEGGTADGVEACRVAMTRARISELAR